MCRQAAGAPVPVGRTMQSRDSMKGHPNPRIQVDVRARLPRSRQETERAPSGRRRTPAAARDLRSPRPGVTQCKFAGQVSPAEAGETRRAVPGPVRTASSEERTRKAARKIGQSLFRRRGRRDPDRNTQPPTPLRRGISSGRTRVTRLFVGPGNTRYPVVLPVLDESGNGGVIPRNVIWTGTDGKYVRQASGCGRIFRPD